jgi:hypothetical protein
MELIGKSCGTDKWGHGFLKFYDSFMSSKKDEPIRFMEIGVFYGASVKMWAQYFKHPGTEIVGADWFKGEMGNTSKFENPRKPIVENIDSRVKYVELDQGSLDELKALKDSQGMFDFILDDGSHLMKHQQQTFGVLFDTIKPGGYFVIEDIHTSFQGGYDVSPTELTTYQMVELLASKQYPNLTHFKLDEDILDKIAEVRIHKTNPGSMTCYIKKV